MKENCHTDQAVTGKLYKVEVVVADTCNIEGRHPDTVSMLIQYAIDHHAPCLLVYRVKAEPVEADE